MCFYLTHNLTKRPTSIRSQIDNNNRQLCAHKEVDNRQCEHVDDHVVATVQRATRPHQLYCATTLSDEDVTDHKHHEQIAKNAQYEQNAVENLKYTRFLACIGA